MDIARFETLEAQVVRLVEAFARVKEENRQVKEENQKLSQDIKQLQDVFDTQQQELAHLRPDHEELTRLRTVMQTLQRERHVIRQKLEQMLVTIEWLEGRVPIDSDTKA
jgi:DNA repair ATPase RecN